MRGIIIRVTLLLASSNVATWLRMFDQTLFLRTWSDLVGEPIRLWIAALLFSGLFELLHLWPAYLLAGSFYLLIAKLKYNEKLSMAGATILGAIVGAATFLIVSVVRYEWLTRPNSYNLKSLIIYTIAGLFYGWSYYYFIIRPRRTIPT